jgi:hypothetical protein
MNNINPSNVVLFLSLSILAALATIFTHVIEKGQSDGNWPKKYYYFFRITASLNLFIALSTLLLKFIVPGQEQPIYPYFYRDLFAASFLLSLPLTSFLRCIRKKSEARTNKME